MPGICLGFGIYYLCTPIRDVSSVGSERMIHIHEVTGSNPVHPTRAPNPNPFPHPAEGAFIYHILELI